MAVRYMILTLFQWPDVHWVTDPCMKCIAILQVQHWLSVLKAGNNYLHILLTTELVNTAGHLQMDSLLVELAQIRSIYDALRERQLSL